ncbi:uncharacterized protein LOC101864200 [Aplysia californica]|uniref:Uncharacterized protein LOC101864200 n=1 Tax=Aplysia californica TaxID=6500 RepID=A0ABM0JE87_APLCA|nr:uncharacterized protein LOC101864200 [Aplysia californica]
MNAMSVKRKGGSLSFPKSASTRQDTNTLKSKQLALKRRFSKLRKRFPDLEPRLLENLLCYALTLVVPGTEELLDTKIFMAEMNLSFGFTNSDFILRIYNMTRGKHEYVTVDDYMLLLTIFYSNDLNRKAEYTFDVYDVDSDNIISTAEFARYLRGGMPISDPDDREANEETLREVMDILTNVMGINDKGYIHKDHYMKVVRDKPEILEFLGQTLPSVYVQRHFTETYISPQRFSPDQVSRYLRSRRHYILQEPKEQKPKQLLGLYPIEIIYPRIE